jgi:uncharacterized protein (UPF0332 family)
MAAMTWTEVGRNCRAAAQLLKEHHPRSSVSRAYYAAFSALNDRLLRHKGPPLRYETHLHQQIPDLIEAHLLKGSIKSRRALRTTIVRLYKARLEADYKLTRSIDDSVALNALRDAKSVFRVLGIDDE